jgi:hypothetical protein
MADASSDVYAVGRKKLRIDLTEPVVRSAIRARGRLFASLGASLFLRA